MLAEQAAKLPAKRWATIAPNYEFGQSAVAAFKKLLSQKRPGHSMGRRAMAAAGQDRCRRSVEAIAAAKPDAIFNATFGPDLVKLVREGNTRGFFEGRSVVSFLTGQPEYLDPLKDEAPVGWMSPAIPGTQLRPPSTRHSSRPTRPSTTTIPGSARSSAIPR